MAKCNFCGLSIARGTGKILVKTDGKIIHLCSMKCEKNLIKLGRKPLNTKWSSLSRKGAKK